MFQIDQKWLVDALERVVWTALQAGAAIIIAADAFDVEVLKAAAIAAGLAAAKAFLARAVGNPESAATLPASGKTYDEGL